MIHTQGSKVSNKNVSFLTKSHYDDLMMDAKLVKDLGRLKKLVQETLDKVRIYEVIMKPSHRGSSKEQNYLMKANNYQL